MPGHLVTLTWKVYTYYALPLLYCIVKTRSHYSELELSDAVAQYHYGIRNAFGGEGWKHRWGVNRRELMALLVHRGHRDTSGSNSGEQQSRHKASTRLKALQQAKAEFSEAGMSPGLTSTHHHSNNSFRGQPSFQFLRLPTPRTIDETWRERRRRGRGSSQPAAYCTAAVRAPRRGPGRQ